MLPRLDAPIEPAALLTPLRSGERPPAGFSGGLSLDAAPKLPHRWYHRAMTDEQFLEERVEHRPTLPCCRDCRHLGEPIRHADRNGTVRVRRHCPRNDSRVTDLDWPVCDRFQPRTAAG